MEIEYNKINSQENDNSVSTIIQFDKKTLLKFVVIVEDVLSSRLILRYDNDEDFFDDTLMDTLGIVVKCNNTKKYLQYFPYFGFLLHKQYTYTIYKDHDKQLATITHRHKSKTVTLISSDNIELKKIVIDKDDTFETKIVNFKTEDDSSSVITCKIKVTLDETNVSFTKDDDKCYVKSMQYNECFTYVMISDDAKHELYAYNMFTYKDNKTYVFKYNEKKLFTLDIQVTDKDSNIHVFTVK